MAQQKKNLKTKQKRMVGKFRLIISLLIAVSIIACAGMYTTIYVPHGDAVRLRETVKNVKVWIKTKEGEIIPGKMDLPAGWYCLPLESD